MMLLKWASRNMRGCDALVAEGVGDALLPQCINLNMSWYFSLCEITANRQNLDAKPTNSFFICRLQMPPNVGTAYTQRISM